MREARTPAAMQEPVASGSIFDWNRESPRGVAPLGFGLTRRVAVVDETLRDGMQNATGVAGPIGAKVDLLHAMVRVGVDVVSVGLPAAGARYAADTEVLCREIREARLPLIATAAARTVVSDVEGIVRASDRAGLPLEVYAFLGSSPIRISSEGWDEAFLVQAVRTATQAAVKAGLKLLPRDGGHDAIAPRRAAHPLPRRRRRGREPPLPLRHHRARHALRRRGARRLCPPRARRPWARPTSSSTGTATTIAASRCPPRSGRWRRPSIACTAPGSASASASATPRSSCSSTTSASSACAPSSRASASASTACSPRAPCAGASRPTTRSPASASLRERGAPPAYRVASDERASDHGVAPSTSGAKPSKPTDRLVPITLRIGGAPVELAVHPRRTLLEALRYDLDLYGTKQGCDKGDCGACTVVLDGKAVLSCLTLALEADGREVETVETLGGAPHLDPLVDCFDRAGGGQCGFCTPGMLMSATALLGRNPSPTRDEIKLAISGNLCRCTGYGRIVDAVEMAAKIKRGEEPSQVDMPGSECVPQPYPSNVSEKSSREEAR